MYAVMVTQPTRSDLLHILEGSVLCDLLDGYGSNAWNNTVFLSVFLMNSPNIVSSRMGFSMGFPWNVIINYHIFPLRKSIDTPSFGWQLWRLIPIYNHPHLELNVPKDPRSGQDRRNYGFPSMAFPHCLHFRTSFGHLDLWMLAQQSCFMIFHDFLPANSGISGCLFYGCAWMPSGTLGWNKKPHI